MCPTPSFYLFAHVHAGGGGGGNSNFDGLDLLIDTLNQAVVTFDRL